MVEIMTAKSEKQTLEFDREWQLLELETKMQLRVKHSRAQGQEHRLAFTAPGSQ